MVPPDTGLLLPFVDGKIVIGGGLGEGAGYACTDFRIGADGFGRVIVGNHALGAAV